MKKRQAKKQIKKCIGRLYANGLRVYNCVSNPVYTGGTCVEIDEDCYRFEIHYSRKRHGAPLLLRNRWLGLYNQIHRNDEQT